MKKHMYAAIGAAFSSPGVGKRRGTRVGAAISKGKRVLGTGFNSYKTHPFMLKCGTYPFMHAEVAAILAVGLDRTPGTVLSVARVTRSGFTAMARPCPACTEAIRRAGISKVYFTTDTKDTVHEISL